MLVRENVSLKPYNSFGIDMPAQFLATINDELQLQEINTGQSTHIIGGGSNILFTSPVKGLVLLNRLQGKKILHEDARHITVEVAAGENWHELVLYAIKNGWGGIENLALIPGTVGAAPMQNIGAYGVEVKETIVSVKAWLWEEKCFASYASDECAFGYRDSIFKHGLKEKAFITSVIFRFSKKPVFKTSYGAIAQELERMNISTLSAKAIAEAVINIRQSKLPDPKKIGNAGSFFKNPVITQEQFAELQKENPTIPSYPSDDKIKIPAGWLIEQCGWKGYRKADVGVHEKQALVLVNYGHASGAEIWQLSQSIVDSVKARFGIELEREVNVW